MNSIKMIKIIPFLEILSMLRCVIETNKLGHNKQQS